MILTVYPVECLHRRRTVISRRQAKSHLATYILKTIYNNNFDNTL